MKLVAGFLIGSVSILSEAIHSAMDLLQRPYRFILSPEIRHACRHKTSFGHGKLENISGTIEALLIFVAAGWIIYEAVDRVLEPKPLEEFGWGIGVMLFSAWRDAVAPPCFSKSGRRQTLSHWKRTPGI